MAASPSRAAGMPAMLVEAAWAAARAPGPLRAFFLRVRSRRGQHVAAVATARKMAVLIWHLLRKGESYAWARPALYAKKLRDLELRAGCKPNRGQQGAASAYNIKSHRDEERRWAEQAEMAYARFVAGWNARGQKCARPPQRRSADEGCAAGLSPQIQLFAARSPMRPQNISEPARKISCRLAGFWFSCGNDRCPRRRDRARIHGARDCRNIRFRDRSARAQA